MSHPKDPVAPNEQDKIARDGMGETPRVQPARPEGTPADPTTAQVRSTVSRSHEPTGIHGSEIAAAPMGTDEEAGAEGPASAETRARAEAAIRRSGRTD